MFESSVNSEGIETRQLHESRNHKFESSVNSEGIETEICFVYSDITFESSVNSEGIETGEWHLFTRKCLRVV